MIRLTDEELDKIDTTGIYDYFKECEKRECIAGNSREAGFNCDGRYLSACEYHKRTVAEEKALIAKAALKKVVAWLLDNELHPERDGLELSGKSLLALLDEVKEA